MIKNKILITGGAGFVGSNLIDFFLKKTKYKIVSLDNYSSGYKKIIFEIQELNISKEIPKILINLLKIQKQ